MNKSFRFDQSNYLFLAPKLISNFIERKEHISRLKSQLLSKNGNSIGLTTGLQGVGGFGKTALSVAICHDTEIKNYFEDGILWITLGETIDNLREKLSDLIMTIEKSDSRSFHTLEAAGQYFGNNILGNKKFLLVLDDVWDSKQLAPFFWGGEKTTRLITTRDSRLLPENCLKIKVGRMNSGEAIELLKANIPNEDYKFRVLAKRLGNWPLLLNLVNRELAYQVKSGISLQDALFDIDTSLQNEGLVAFDLEDDKDRSKAVKVTVESCLRHIPENFRIIFRQLCVFQPDEKIPLVTLSRFFGGVPEKKRNYKVRQFCQLLEELSLVDSFVKDKNQTDYIVLHDVIVQFLQSNKDIYNSKTHNSFLGNYNIKNWSDLPEYDDYIWNNIIFHLIQSGKDEIAFELCMDVNYAAKKLFKYKSFAYENDLLEIKNIGFESISSISRKISNSSHLINKSRSVEEVVSILLSKVFHDIQIKTKPNFSFFKPIFEVPDMPDKHLTRTLIGHEGRIYGCDISADDKFIATASDDQNLIIWDSESGAINSVLSGHKNRVFCCKFDNKNEFLYSGGADFNICKWAIRTGKIESLFKGHSGAIWSCDLNKSNTLLLTASEDESLGVWNLETGESTFLKGHNSPVTGCKFYEDGEYIISSGHDKMVKIWKKSTNGYSILKTLSGHNAAVWSCDISDNGIIISSSIDCDLRLWSIKTMEKIGTPLKGHTGPVWGCSISRDGKYSYSVSEDLTVKIWNNATQSLVKTLVGHTRYVWGCSLSKNSQKLLSCSLDKTTKIWDLKK